MQQSRSGNNGGPCRKHPWELSPCLKMRPEIRNRKFPQSMSVLNARRFRWWPAKCHTTPPHAKIICTTCSSRVGSITQWACLALVTLAHYTTGTAITCGHTEYISNRWTARKATFCTLATSWGFIIGGSSGWS